MRKLSLFEMAAATLAVIILTIQLTLWTYNVIKNTSSNKILTNQAANSNSIAGDYFLENPDSLMLTDVSRGHACKH